MLRWLDARMMVVPDAKERVSGSGMTSNSTISASIAQPARLRLHSI
jgi:hypothetical protein